NRPERSCRQSTTTRDPFLVLGELPGHLPAAALPWPRKPLSYRAWLGSLEAHEGQCNNANHCAPPDVPAARGYAVAETGVAVHDNRNRNDPLPSGVRAEPGSSNQQDTNGNPIHSAGLPHHAQQLACPVRLNARPVEHSELGAEAVANGHDDGQGTGNPK